MRFGMAVVQCTIYRGEQGRAILRSWQAGPSVRPPTAELEIIMLFAALIERVRIWRRERETLAELNRLNERDLFDIGINPVDIRAIARQAARA